jgi:hypothetical protein
MKKQLLLKICGTAAASTACNYTFHIAKADRDHSHLNNSAAHIYTLNDEVKGSDGCSADIDTDFEIVTDNAGCSDDDEVDQSELNRIVDIFALESTLLNSLFPASLSPHDREDAMKSILQKVRKVFDDPHLLKEMASSEQPLLLPNVHRGVAFNQKDCTSLWNELVNDHKCMICSDLLAGPVILGCSHSFCGVCVNQMREAWESDDSDTIYTCPTCRHEIENEIFERVLDDIIAQKVTEVPDCEQKRDWAIRRQAYQKAKKAKSMEEKLRGDDTTTPEYIIVAVIVIVTLVMAAYRRMNSR